MTNPRDQKTSQIRGLGGTRQRINKYWGNEEGARETLGGIEADVVRQEEPELAFGVGVARRRAGPAVAAAAMDERKAGGRGGLRCAAVLPVRGRRKVAVRPARAGNGRTMWTGEARRPAAGDFHGIVEWWAVIFFFRRRIKEWLVFFVFFKVGVIMMRCSSLGASGSLDDDYRAQIVCVIPPSLSFYISRDFGHIANHTSKSH